MLILSQAKRPTSDCSTSATISVKRHKSTSSSSLFASPTPLLTAMSRSHSPDLETVTTIWTIADTLIQYISAGDLINLARTSTKLRAALHGFSTPTEPARVGHVRRSLYVGIHETPHWRKLKDRVSFLCGSKTHTKGPDPQPCKLCDRPICQACIVRSAFANPKRQMFKDRCRYLCKLCWESGNPQKKRKLPRDPTASEYVTVQAWCDPDRLENPCQCTAKETWVCLECQEEQEQGAHGKDQDQCFGENCTELLGEGKQRRTICIWCDKPHQRTRVSGEAQHAWTTKMIEARTRREESRRADLEEYHRLRLQQLRMSRRQLRGDASVRSDPDADTPQFVRDLDTVNYERFVGRQNAPDGRAIYLSKSGKFTYSRRFLHSFNGPCLDLVPARTDLKSSTTSTTTGSAEQVFSRTNAEKIHDRKCSILSPRDLPWHHLKSQVLQLHHVAQRPVAVIKETMRRDFHFNADEDEYIRRIERWCGSGDDDDNGMDRGRRRLPPMESCTELSSPQQPPPPFLPGGGTKRPVDEEEEEGNNPDTTVESSSAEEEGENDDDEEEKEEEEDYIFIPRREMKGSRTNTTKTRGRRSGDLSNDAEKSANLMLMDPKEEDVDDDEEGGEEEYENLYV